MTPDTVIKHFGSARSTADSLGMTSAAVHQWVRKGRIPYPSQVIIQIHTNGKLKAKKA